MAKENTHADESGFIDPIFRGLRIEGLISAPLRAAISANAMLARDQVEFLLDFCFARVGDSHETNKYVPVMIKMTLTRGVIVPGETSGEEPYIKQYNLDFEVPLLTLIPLNSLSVRSVNVGLEIEVTHSQAIEIQDIEKNELEGGVQGQEAALYGHVAPTSKQKSTGSKSKSHQDTHKTSDTDKSTLSVDLVMETIPLPKGLTTLLDFYTKAIQPTDGQDFESGSTIA